MVAAIAAPIAGIFGGGAIATTAVQLALYAGVSAASILLQMSMATEQKQEIGTKLDVEVGGAVNQSFQFWNKETAGSFIYRGTWGISGRVPNAYLTRVFCLGDRPVSGFKSHIWAAGRKCNYDPGEMQIVDGVNLGHPVNAFNSSGGHRLWVKFHDGTQTSADNYLVEKFHSDPNKPWTENHIGRGRPYMVVTQKYDKKQPEGEIEVLAVVDDSEWYDWREDSTNGGSGSQRYGLAGTYAPAQGNAIVGAYNVMRGVYFGNEWLFGGQAWPKTRFDNDTWTAAANKCDTNVALKGGGSQKWAKAGAEIDVSDEPWTVIERFLKACNGRLVESGGVFKVYVGGIGASVYSFTDGDIIVSEELSGRLFPTREEIANTVNGTYIEPANGGEAKAFKPRTNADFVAQDGDVRKTAVDYDYVRDNVQAQRMAVHALREGRRFRTFVVAFWTQARKLEPCDVVSWTSERLQFEDKKFIVGDVVLRPDGVVIVNLREADNADSNWETSDEDAYETGVFEVVEPPPQTLMATVTATAITDDDDVTERRPAIRIQATVDDEFVDCRALRYQVRKRFGDQRTIYRGRSEGFFEPGDDDYGDVTFTSNAFIAKRQVQVRFKIEPESDRDTAWSNWADHTVTLTDVPEVNNDPPPDLAAAPTLTLKTRTRAKSGEIVQRLLVDLDLTGRDENENYAIRVVDTTESPSETTRHETKEFPFPIHVTAEHSYQIRVRPISRYGVPGNLSGLATGVSMPIAAKATGPGQATGVTWKRRPRGMRGRWDKCTDPDYKETAILRRKLVSDPWVEIDRVTATTYLDDDETLLDNVNYRYKVVHYNRSNVAAADSAESNLNFELIAITDTSSALLLCPTVISLTQANRDLNADGTVETALKGMFTGFVPNAGSYEMQWLDSAGQTGYITAPGGTVFFQAVTTRSYQIRWRTITWNNLPSRATADGLATGQPGAWSAYTTSVTPAATAGAPATPSGAAASGDQLGFYVSWTQPSEFDYAYTEVATRLSAGTPSNSDLLITRSANYGFVFAPDIDSHYVYVRHVNTSNLKSAWALASGSPVTTVNAQGVQFASDNMNASNTGSVNVGIAERTELTFSWVCDSNTTGVNITIGSRTYNSITFVNNQPMSLSHMETGGGAFSVSKTGGGSWRGADFTAKAQLQL